MKYKKKRFILSHILNIWFIFLWCRIQFNSVQVYVQAHVTWSKQAWPKPIVDLCSDSNSQSPESIQLAGNNLVSKYHIIYHSVVNIS